MKTKWWIACVLLLLLMIIFFVACGQFKPPLSETKTQHSGNPTTDTVVSRKVPTHHNPYLITTSTLPDSVKIHVLWGTPYDADTSNDYLIFRAQYALSYNRFKGVPNWASWELDDTWYGTAGRFKGNFITDYTLPDSFYKPTHNDYTGTGYDRGHVVQSHERSRSPEDNKATFWMSNVMPQTPDLNRGVWLKFENFCKTLCLDSGYKLLIVAGGVYHSNTTLNKLGKVAIPDSCFKIVIASKNSLDNIDSSTAVYAVMMPNIQGIRKDAWQRYRTSIKQIEHSTGYNFFSEIPENLQNYLENK
ncbi:MAG: DNA/RNA non-specific endonuclease [Bacteroidia bacterium]|nr:DNA/RNA non-specific endonuclease [Bacteroidia bacterium]MCO5253782.1 DNA/RNA non-specific endonuclease [Bacteroidota bacterium]MCZ2130790.1 DNA/RNA non-specific endonuclease [Bacteroidia bacterium]